MKLVTKSKEIGLTHSLIQLIVFGLISGGTIFLLPMALAEITGWVLLILWTGYNFIGLPIIIKLLDNFITKKTRILGVLKIMITGLIGGLLGFTLNLVYYKFHMFFIKKEFNLSDYYNDFFNIVTTLTISIISAELIRIRKTIF